MKRFAFLARTPFTRAKGGPCQVLMKSDYGIESRVKLLFKKGIILISKNKSLRMKKQGHLCVTNFLKNQIHSYRCFTKINRFLLILFGNVVERIFIINAKN